MYERSTQTQAQPARQAERSTHRRDNSPIRRASEVLGILDPRPVNPMAATPAGFWKTGWLPKPEGATS